MIKANKTLTLDVPIVSKYLGHRRLVRTGAYGDGNCFIHALLRAIDIGYRRQTSYTFHLKLVERFRKDVAEWITPECFKSLGNGEQIRVAFLAELNLLLDGMYAQIDQHPSPIIQVLYKLLSRKEIDMDIFPNVLVKSKQNNFYLSFCQGADALVRQKLVGIDSSKVNAICTQMYEHFIHLFQEAHKNCLEKFKARLTTMGEFVDSLQLECLSKYTGYNFVFINESKDNQAYSGSSHVVSFEDTRKCLIFLWVDENHFEIVGELEEKNMINRIFDSSDPLIPLLANNEPAVDPVPSEPQSESLSQ